MLSPNEFSVGRLSDVDPGTLLLPITSRDPKILIGWSVERFNCVILDGPDKFTCLNSVGDSEWRGMLIPNIELIVDPLSSINPSYYEASHIGAVTRSGSSLAIFAKAGNGIRSSRTTHVNIHDNLPSSAASGEVGFLHWQIVIGTGYDRRVLFKIDLRESGSTN